MYRVTFLHGQDIDNCNKFTVTYKENELPVDIISEFFKLNPEAEGIEQIYGFEINTMVDNYGDIKINTERINVIKDYE